VPGRIFFYLPRGHGKALIALSNLTLNLSCGNDWARHELQLTAARHQSKQVAEGTCVAMVVPEMAQLGDEAYFIELVPE